MKKGGWSKGRWSKRGAVVKRGVGKNYYVELFGEILAITKMGNSGLDGAISPTGVAFLELQWKGKGRSAPTLPKTPPPTLSGKVTSVKQPTVPVTECS